MPQDSENPWLKRFAVLTAVATLFLICVGGLVTSYGVGMAVPDWPNTYGYNMFFFPISKWIGGVFWEHSHRLVASAVGFLTTILLIWFYGRKARVVLKWIGIFFLLAGVATLCALPSRKQDGALLVGVGLLSLGCSFFWPNSESAEKWRKRLGWIAFGSVILQGILGGLRVTQMKDELGIFHATLAQMFFVLISAIALFQTNWWNNLPAASLKDSKRLRFSFVAITLLILGQLVLGATMRHQHAGLAIPDFPAAYGKIWPDTSPEAIARYNQDRVETGADRPITAFQIGLQMAHRGVAFIIFAAVAYVTWLTRRQLGWKNLLCKISAALLVLIVIQVCLGAATVLTGKKADIATAHVAVGALSLMTGTLLSIISLRIFEAKHEVALASEDTPSFIQRSIAASEQK